MQVILASKSPRRKELLMQVGMDPLVMDSQVEEVTEALSPEALVRENAARKGRKVAAAAAPDALVIAADTVVVDERGILGKPKDREDAVRMLQRLSGRTHMVHTGLYMSLDGKEHLSVTTTQVTFCPLRTGSFIAILKRENQWIRLGPMESKGRPPFSFLTLKAPTAMLLVFLYPLFLQHSTNWM